MVSDFWEAFLYVSMLLQVLQCWCITGCFVWLYKVQSQPDNPSRKLFHSSCLSSNPTWLGLGEITTREQSCRVRTPTHSFRRHHTTSWLHHPRALLKMGFSAWCLPLLLWLLHHSTLSELSNSPSWNQDLATCVGHSFSHFMSDKSCCSPHPISPKHLHPEACLRLEGLGSLAPA